MEEQGEVVVAQPCTHRHVAARVAGAGLPRTRLSLHIGGTGPERPQVPHPKPGASSGPDRHPGWTEPRVPGPSTGHRLVLVRFWVRVLKRKSSGERSAHAAVTTQTDLVSAGSVTDPHTAWVWFLLCKWHDKPIVPNRKLWRGAEKKLLSTSNIEPIRILTLSKCILLKILHCCNFLLGGHTLCCARLTPGSVLLVHSREALWEP